MSQQNSPAKQEHWERLFGSLEIDVNDTDTTTVKTMESGGCTTRSDGKYQEYEIQKLLDEVDRKCNKDRIEQLELLLEEADKKIESLNENIMDMEERIRAERDQTELYFKAMDTLEKENERLREENVNLSQGNESLKKSLYVAERQIEAAKKESLVKAKKDQRQYLNVPQSQLDPKQRKHNFLRDGAILERGNESDSSIEDASRMSSCDRSRLSFYVDDSWIKKLKFLKEKLINEKKKCKNLQFLVDAQKTFTENTNQTISKLKSENQALEQKLDKLRCDFEDLAENKAKERAKIDNVITFCDLLGTCSFSRDEISDQLMELPGAVSSFLKGSSDTIVLKNNNISPTFASQKQRISSSEGLSKAATLQQDKKTEEMAQELDSIRKTLTNVSYFLTKVFPTTDPSVLTNLESISKIRLSLKEGVTDDMKGMVNPRLAKNETIGKTGFSNSRIFTKAIQNSSSLLWNLKLGSKNKSMVAMETRNEDSRENQENIDKNQY